MDNMMVEAKRRQYEEMPIEGLIDLVALLSEQAELHRTLARVASEVLRGRAQQLINNLK